MTCKRCDGRRWVCETHPDQTRSHGVCGEAGMRCRWRSTDRPVLEAGHERPPVPQENRQTVLARDSTDPALIDLTEAVAEFTARAEAQEKLQRPDRKE